MRNLNSKYGHVAKTAPIGPAKAFFVVPSGSAILPETANHFVPDEEGVVRVYTDPASAIAAVVSGRCDNIYFLPGTYTITTALAATSVDDVNLIALGTEGSTILTGSGANILNLTTCKGWNIRGFQWNLASTKKCIALVGCSGINIQFNTFLSAVGGAASHFIHMLTTASTYCRITDNRFISNLVVAGGAITQTSHITGLGIGHIIERNVFVAGEVTTANQGTVTTGILFANAADCGNVIRENSFTEFNSGVFTAGVDYGTTALGGSVLCHNNNFMLATAANAVVNGSNAGNFANNIASGTV
jgi:hypothetical protein